MTVEEFSSGLAECRLLVTTPRKTNFFDEIQVAMSLPDVQGFDRVIGPGDRAELARFYRYPGGALPTEAERMTRREARLAALAKPPSAEHALIVPALVEKAPWPGGLWLQLIDIRQRLGDGPGAIAAARRGAAHAPIWEGRERLAEAEMRYLYLLFAAGTPGRSAQVVNQLGVVYLHLGALARAERCFRDALAENPGLTLTRGKLTLVTHLPPGARRRPPRFLGRPPAAPAATASSATRARPRRVRAARRPGRGPSRAPSAANRGRAGSAGSSRRVPVRGPLAHRYGLSARQCAPGTARCRARRDPSSSRADQR
jgi:hypothetical protein